MDRYLFPRSGFVLTVLITMQITQVACLAQLAPAPPGIGDSTIPTTQPPGADGGARNYINLTDADAFLERGKFKEAIAGYRSFLERYLELDLRS